MKGTKLRKVCTVCLLAVILACISLLELPHPAFAARNATNYEKRTGPCPVRYGDVWLVINDYSGTSQNILFDGKSAYNDRFPGATYDLASNTMTLDNFRHPEVTVAAHMMGDDFTIRVIGECEVKYLDVSGDMYTDTLGKEYLWGGSLNITGTGTLTVYKARDDENSPWGITLWAWGCDAKLDISRSVSLKAYGYKSEPAVRIMHSAGFYDKQAITVDGKAFSSVYPKYTVTGFQSEGEPDYKDYWIKASELLIKGTGKEPAALGKKVNPMTVKGKTATVRYKKLKKKTQTLPLSKVMRFTKAAKGKVTFKKVSGNKKITINKKTGKVTVKKRLKKGTYKVKVKVTAAGNDIYKKRTRTVIFRIRIK